ncbi:transglycosylase domain-containing protein [Chitinibacter sp. GC72]|uniref:transglycosylase domain-containing protein n=1 Tax=Chitinibacter sp. GC72 TaxID=1526917 RepID=UPI0012FC34A3|nr:transglycosylase domain-containing protein [Chitinibacter sp. GC72]
MQRLLRRLAISIVVLIGCICLATLVFDILMVRPVVLHIERTLSEAKPSERKPPKIVTDMVRKAYGSRLIYAVIRNALSASNQVKEMKTMHRQLTEFCVGILLPLHLSDAEIESFYISTAYIGNRIYGFSLASEHYFGTPLERISMIQAARLLAITHAPSAYLANPEGLERRVQYLLSL